MKKALKIFGITLGFILLAIIVLLVIGKIKEKEIADIAFKKISASIKAPLAIGNISLNLLRKFPLATIEFEEVRLGTSGSLIVSDTVLKDNTLANIEKLYVSVRTIPLFRGELDILKVEIKGVNFNYIVDSLGTSNFDFLIDTTSTDNSAPDLNIKLKELTLRDIHCNYYDYPDSVNAQIVIPKARISGELRKDYLRGSIKGDLKITNCNYKTSPLHLMNETAFDFDLNYCDDSLNVKELAISTDGAEFSIFGSIILKDTLKTDINIEGTKLNIGELIKYAPKKTLKDIGLIKTSGEINLKASIQGYISDSILPEVKINVKLKDGTLQSNSYPSLNNISFSGYLTNGKLRNNKTTSASFSKFHAETGKSSIDMSFNLNNLNRIHYKINSDIDIDLADFKKLIPDTVISDAKGHIRATLATKGILPDTIGNGFIDYVLQTSTLNMALNNLYLTFDSTLSLNSLSGNFAYKLNRITADNINVNIPNYKVNIINTSFDAILSGKPSQPSTFGIDLKSFLVNTDSCSASGSLKIKGLKFPEYTISSNIRLNMDEVKSILPDTLINKLSGEIIAQVSSSGKMDLDSISTQIADLVFNNSTFQLNFNKVTVEMPDTLLKVKEFSGKISMKPGTIEINDAHGTYSGIDFNIDSTKIENLYNSVIRNLPSQLIIDGRFNLGDLDFTMFAPFITENADTSKTSGKNKEASSDGPQSETTNYTYLIKGKIRIKSFTYKKAVVNNISSLFKLTDSLYLADQFKFSGFGGQHNTSVRYAIKEKERMLWVKNSVEGMDVRQLLMDFDNFKEYYKPSITYENISGLFSANVDGQVLFKGDSLIRNKLYVRGDIKLEKGGIYNYQPLIDMEPYLPGINNLAKLEFKTINSNIFIFQDAIYVPTTVVISNKLDASALGMKSLGEDYSYHFMVFLGDVLTGKSKKLIKKQEEMGDEITDAGRKGTLVKSYSENGKSHSGRDTKENQAEMKRKVKASEALLDLRFHPKIINYNTGVN